MKDESNIKTMGLIALLGIGALFLLSKSKKQQPLNDIALTLQHAAIAIGFNSDEGYKVKKLIDEGKLQAFERDGKLFVWQSEANRYYFSIVASA